MVLFFIWAMVDTENRAENCSAWNSRRREIAVMPPSRFIRRVLKTCTNEHADGARGRRMGRGIHGRSAGWACRGRG